MKPDLSGPAWPPLPASARFIVVSDLNGAPHPGEMAGGTGVLGGKVTADNAAVAIYMKYEDGHPSRLAVGQSVAGVAAMSGAKPTRYHVVRVE